VPQKKKRGANIPQSKRAANSRRRTPDLAASPRSLYAVSDRTREIPANNPEDYRTEWRRDYARVIHCPAFRRLQGKTQLFPGIETDFFRNRLTHSVEVAQIAKSIAIKLNATVPFFQRDGFAIDTDLVETAALVHDIGHPPFGHNGEKALDECMKSKGGFEGNAQTLRILAKLEKRGDRRDGASPSGILPLGLDGRVGLNLCHRTLGAALKYDAQIEYDRPQSSKLQKGYYTCEADLVRRIKQSVVGQPDFKGFKTVECQIMDIADDIAYSTYDLEDSFKAKFLTPLSLFGPNEKLTDEVCKRVSQGLKRSYTRQEMVACLFIPRIVRHERSRS
jgi:dGTPase